LDGSVTFEVDCIGVVDVFGGHPTVREAGGGRTTAREKNNI
jgi:hypothetical protein